jgi:hypothetical protein
MPVSMTDDDDDDDGAEAFTNFFAAKARALAVHEAGHAAVAHGLGAEVCFVEIDVWTGNGWSRSRVFDDNVKNLAVCVAGCRAEHAFGASSPRGTKKGDLRDMRKLLSLFPEADHRRAARAEAYRLADVTLKANADIVHRIADALFARWDSADARIQGDELAELLAGAAQLELRG